MAHPPLSTQQLDLVEATFRLPSPSVATFTHTGLQIAPGATEADLLALGNCIFAVRSWAKWGLGSVFAEMMRKRPHPDARNHPGEYDLTWASDFADAHHLDPKERRELLGVFLFYREGSPTPGLSFEHHREAMWGAANLAPEGVDMPTGGVPPSAPSVPSGGATTKAAAYLREAAAESLSVTQLRARIRATQRTTQETPAQTAPLDLASYSAVFDFHRYCARELPNLGRCSPERARVILADLGQEALDYIAALQSKAARGAPSLAISAHSAPRTENRTYQASPPLPRHKESFA